jgi:alpha-L-fucosidase
VRETRRIDRRSYYDWEHTWSLVRGASFLLNVPPDRRGRIHANDERSLRAFGGLLERTFASDLAPGARASASNVRGGEARFAAANVRDADRESYWSTDDGVTTPDWCWTSAARSRSTS